MLKKILIGLFVFCVVVGAVAYFGAQALVKNGSEKMLGEMARLTSGKSVELVGPRIKDAKVSFAPVGIEWEGFESSLKTATYKEVWGVEELSVNFDSITVNANDSKYESFIAELKKGEVLPLASGSNQNGFEFKRLGVEYLALPFDLDSAKPEESVRRLLEGLGEFVVSGESQQPISLKGTLGFLANGEEQEMAIKSSQSGDIFSIEADRKSMADLVSNLQGEWTEAEIDVAARHPIQAPLIMFLSDYAVAKSKAAAARDSSVPEDAYRHLLWSYMLTERVGEKLAKEVTDAHEVGATDNTEADHRMDYQNNALGRRYANEGRAEEEILVLAKTDPAVVRSP